MSSRLKKIAKYACGGKMPKKLYGGRVATHKDSLNNGGPIDGLLKQLQESKYEPTMYDKLADSLEYLYFGDTNAGDTIANKQSRNRRLAREQMYADRILQSGLLEQDMPNMQRSTTEVKLPMLLDKLRKGGNIHIAKNKRGTFTAAATKHNMGVQEFAKHVLSNKDKFSSKMVKKANFARNASKWKKELGGEYLELGGFLQDIAPLMSVIPGASGIGAGVSALGSLIENLKQDDQPLYKLNQMENGGPVDPPKKKYKSKALPYDFNPPLGSPGDRLAQQQYKALVNNPGFSADYLDKREDQLSRLILSGSVANDEFNMRNPSKEPELVKQFNTTGKPEQMVFSFAQQHAIDQARRALEKGVGYSGMSFEQMRNLKKRKQMRLGGDFKQYSAPTHKAGGQLIDANGNPTMNMPVAEIEKNENSHGGYVFSDHLKNPSTGNTFAKDAKKIAKQTSREDDISKSSRILQLMKLRQKNELMRQAEEVNEQGVPMAEEGLPFLPTRGGVRTTPRAFPYNYDLISEAATPEFYTVGDAENALGSGVAGAAKAAGYLGTIVGNQTLPSDTEPAPVEKAATRQGLSTLNSIAAGLKGAALGYGAIDALRGSEQEQLQLPDYSRGDQYYRGLEVDLAPALGEINMAATKGIQDVSNQASGIGARNSRVNAILSRAGKNAAQVQLQQQQANAGIRAQLGSREDMKSQTVAGERIRQQIAQSQNDATARLAERKFFSDLSQVGTSLNNIQYMNDAMKNQNELGQQSIRYGLAVLANKYPNFKPDPGFIERLKSGTLTEADKPLLDQLVQFASTGR